MANAIVLAILPNLGFKTGLLTWVADRGFLVHARDGSDCRREGDRYLVG